MIRWTAFAVILLLCGCGARDSFTPMQFWASGLAWEGHAARVSSYDRTGANNDNIRIPSGETATLAEIAGPGVIRHIWTTTNATGPVGRTMVIRMYWDGSDQPAVEVPYGDFFAEGHGMQADVQSFPITVISEGRSRNCWWPMPFSESARITITNEGPGTEEALYFYIDYLALEKAPPTRQRFHALYRQAHPADFPGNYVILETSGRGQYLGCLFNVTSTEPQWWGEGDDLIEVDDNEPLHGTGTEDYFSDAWGMRESQGLWHGTPICEGYDSAGLRSSMYRFHLLDPIPFRKNCRVSIEHGTQNDRADHLSSVAYWYQEPPAAPYPPFPAVEERLMGDAQIALVRGQLWRWAMTDDSGAEAELDRLGKMKLPPELVHLHTGLSLYRASRQQPTSEALARLDQEIAAIDRMLSKIPEEELFGDARIDFPTDNDAPVPNSLLEIQTMLQRARHDLARKLALARGFEPGDELLVEVRDFGGKLTQPPTYSETPDFSNSYAKVQDPRMMGSGARFTYGGTSPSWARFTPDIPRAGMYQVLVTFSYGSNAADTRYRVDHHDGSTTVPVPQRGRPGTPDRNSAIWIDLGTYRFTAGQTVEHGSITLLTDPGEQVPNKAFEYRAYADAVRLVYISE